MQKNCGCHFLFGADTSEHVTQQMLKALEGREEYQAEVHLYKKNGECERTRERQVILHNLKLSQRHVNREIRDNIETLFDIV